MSIAEKPKAPKDQPIELLPLRWRIYLSKVNTYNFIYVEECGSKTFDTWCFICMLHCRCDNCNNFMTFPRQFNINYVFLITAEKI